MKKKLKGREYLYLYRSKWKNKRPVSEFVRYLGPRDKYTQKQLDNAIKEIERELEEDGKLKD